MINTERAGQLASTLAADGYLLDIAEAGPRVRVTISATPQACADCLVPKPMMRSYFEAALSALADTKPREIRLIYPADAGTH